MPVRADQGSDPGSGPPADGPSADGPPADGPYGPARILRTRRTAGCRGTAATARRSARESVDKPTKAVDRALQRCRHLKGTLKRRQHGDQLRARLDDLSRSVGDLTSAHIDPVAEVAHRVAELEQLGGPNVESFAENHDRRGALIELPRDEQYLAAELRDLLAEIDHPVELARQPVREPRDRPEFVQDAAEDRLRRLDGETKDTHVKGPAGTGELRGKDSNLEFQGQNLASCRLLHPAVV